jgi:hypothetical protein
MTGKFHRACVGVTLPTQTRPALESSDNTGSGALNLENSHSKDLHNEIVRIEDRIERLTEKIESCRKLILASRIAVVGGTIVLTVMLFGAMRFDPAIMAAAVAALLGGIAVWGSNRSTAKEATTELTIIASDRSMLIQQMNLKDVTPLRAFSAGAKDDTIV